MFFTDSAAVTRAFMSRKNGWRRERERRRRENKIRELVVEMVSSSPLFISH